MRAPARVLPLLAASIALALCPIPAAAELKTLSGSWSASPMRSVWNVGDWGAACGPKPGGGGAPGGTATIAQKGGELVISGAGRTYSTSGCWEQFPGLVRQSHSGGQRGWRTVCRSGAGDPRQTTIITTVSASDSYITFDETGQYQFVVGGQNCTASVRRSRSFRLLQREGEAAAPALSREPAPLAASAAAAPAARCSEPGAPARLEVRPARKLMRPGETFVFRASVLDGAGCVVRTPTNWRVVTQQAPLRLTAPGTIRVFDDAKEAEVVLSATVADRSVEVRVEIASSERYAALLQTGAFTLGGESKDAAVIAIASGSVGARPMTVNDGTGKRRTTFVAILGGAALILGTLGVILVVRGRRRRRELEAAASGSSREIADAGTKPSGPPTRNLFCPTCHEEYAFGSQFCPNDGNRLLPVRPESGPRAPSGGVCPVCGQGYDPGVMVCPRHLEELVPAAVGLANQDAEAHGGKICPVCGTQYTGDGRFCGADGAALVPVN